MKKTNKKVQKKTVQGKKTKPVLKAKAKIKPKKSVIKPKAKVQPKTKKAVPKGKVKEVATVKAKKTTPRKRNLVHSTFDPIDVPPYFSKKSEDYMSQKQTDHFQEILLKWKEQLMADVDRTMHHMQDESSNYPDPVDRASQEEEFNLELRTRDRDRKLLKKIDDALMRINDHNYGYCDDCGAEIGVRRLEARPTATQCIECKTISEIREKQIGDV